ncbi:SulP family inorganic anion transporter [Actinokineospora globicatena]|uniref:SulP family inorganic anion transporter n=1 Tax=Actinokineospora globicatena TaxID=103729 RepID=UPI0020A44509|nr:SulP family inorganic anion transporter [Actinokineospora globicatena]MCP2302177.1 Sulfate permease, MFS superfamily [Actinokineospora globicatena]GLW76161.1 sulfate transporter [Actinokineospora globicatena]GLW82997.1 sulfate transporter [Actinokineospora globicatena]
MSEQTEAPVSGKADPARRRFPLGDVKSGFLVSLIALPLCLGIALASGFPPIAGVLTAIVGGILGGLLGGAPLTIKGPAAGLIVIAVGAVHDLGQGDAVAGYRRALAVGVVAALIQILFAAVRAAGIGVAMSPSVVHGMLAAIGVIIIAKQAHVVLGVKPTADTPLGLLAEIPRSVAHANPLIVLIGVVALLILFGLPLVRARWSKSVPAPLVVLAVAIPIGLLLHLSSPHDYRLADASHHLGPEFLVRLPGSVLDAITFPDFSQVFSGTSLQYVAMFALIGTIESTLTVLAVDSMDPAKRPSDLNRDLFAIGAGNLTAAFIGGLPMISEIVRSKANLDAGAKSRWSNVCHGAILLLFVALIPGLVQTIPLAALAAMLVYTGFRLANPREVAHVGKIGWDQLLLFLTTLVVTLATDLLVGVAAGLALKIVLHLVRGVPLFAFLRPRPEVTRDGEVLRVRIPGAAVFPALLPLRRAITKNGDGVTEIVVDVRDATLVDHTFLTRLDQLAKELPEATLRVEGLDGLDPVSAHPQALRRRPRS